MPRSRTPILGWLATSALAGALAACNGEKQREPADPAVVQPGPSASGPESHDAGTSAAELSEDMPGEGLEADGRISSWAIAVQISATMQALSAACGHHDDAARQEARDGQRGQLAAAGVAGDRVDAVWDWAERVAEQKIAAQPAAELESGCARLIEMEEEARRMGEAMRTMSLPGS